MRLNFLSVVRVEPNLAPAAPVVDLQARAADISELCARHGVPALAAGLIRSGAIRGNLVPWASASPWALVGIRLRPLVCNDLHQNTLQIVLFLTVIVASFLLRPPMWVIQKKRCDKGNEHQYKTNSRKD
jgi:hypothetical protein